MRRFYRLVASTHGEAFDVDVAAWLEVEWWRVHREMRHDRPGDVADLVEALTALYAHVYGVDADLVRPAAVERADAMVISDGWVAAGRDPSSPALVDERAALIRSYAALLAAVHRPAGDRASWCVGQIDRMP